MSPSSATMLAARAASSTAASNTTIQLPSSLKVVGIILAIASGVLIGSSFVFKKKGLLRSQAGHTAGEGVAYLKSLLWWTGMIMMILGELCNFAAYAFVEALVVTPMGALSVVISAILSSIFLQEKLTFFGWLGCSLCIIGSVIIALNGPQEQTPSQISQFKKMFLAPGFLAYIGVLIAIALSIILYFGPKYGKKNMLWYITVCSTIGGISVSVTTGLGSAIVTSVMGYNQFNNWFIFFLMGFVVVTLLTEVYYLNVALALFNTAMVTPTYYVLFSFCSMATTIVLFQGLAAPVSQIITLVLAFLTICVGITILQMSKIDPAKLTSLDRRSTLLLTAARAHTDRPATIDFDGDGDEKVAGLEDPGIDALRGSFGTVGSIIRARSSRRFSQSSRSTGSASRVRGMGVGGGMVGNHDGLPFSSLQHTDHSYDGLTRHALYDAPMPALRGDSTDRDSEFTASSTQSPRRTTIKFGNQDVVHSYVPTGNSRNSQAVHALRNTTVPANLDTKAPPSFLYPPTSNTNTNTTPIPLLPPPDGDRPVPLSPQSTGSQPGAQSVILPRRGNDEPLAPTVSSRFATHPETDPFQTPSTPSMSAFPSSGDLLTNVSYSNESYSNVVDPPNPLHPLHSVPLHPQPQPQSQLQPYPPRQSSFAYALSTSTTGSSGSETTLYATPLSTHSPVPRPSQDSVRSGSRSIPGLGSGPGSIAGPGPGSIAGSGGRRSSSTSRTRKYPKGVDDAEERLSLWDQSNTSPVDEEGEGDLVSEGEGAGVGVGVGGGRGGGESVKYAGVRLVQKGGDGRTMGLGGRF